MLRRVALALLTLLACTVCVQAQDEEKPPKTADVRITFLPPPIKGTLTLGIYNKAGKLVRVLHREATEEAFTVGLNGLITTWDGKDDSGAVLPPGKYHARGYSVGTLEVEGVAYHCNDFMVDESSPQVSYLQGVRLLPTGEPAVTAKLADGKIGELIIGEDGVVKQFQPVEGVQEEDAEKPVVIDGKELRAGSFPDLQKPIDAARGKDNTVWIIDQTPAGAEVKQYSGDGEFLRRLAPAAGEPVPQKIAASTTDDRIYILEKAAGVQRVRGLMREDLPPSAEATEAGAVALSTWKTLFSKQIVACDSFAAVADKLGRPQAFTPEAKITIRVLPNPLFKNVPASVSLEIAIDPEGSYLRTTDALPLFRLTETPNLKWAVMGRENGSRAVTIFQSDGVIVEEFRLRRLANMMAFDAGEYDWTGK